MKRIFKILLMIAIIFILLFLYARNVEPKQLTVKKLLIETEKDIEYCKVVFFTDTHFSGYYDKEYLKKIVAKINEREADIVIFGGDLLDNYTRDREELDLNYLKEELSKIEAKNKKLAVCGNHDYGGGAERIYEEFMTSCGFQVLVNENCFLDEYNIRVIGYDDYLLGQTEPSLYYITSETFNIIVAHEPVISTIIESSSDNFMFSGHTHGGQVFVPFLTKKIIPNGSGGFIKGLYRQEDIGTETRLNMYVSSGIGQTKYPVRFLNVPEIVEIEFIKIEN